MAIAAGTVVGYSKDKPAKADNKANNNGQAAHITVDKPIVRRETPMVPATKMAGAAGNPMPNEKQTSKSPGDYCNQSPSRR